MLTVVTEIPLPTSTLTRRFSSIGTLSNLFEQKFAKIKVRQVLEQVGPVRGED
jgi:hypothetical protein